MLCLQCGTKQPNEAQACQRLRIEFPKKNSARAISTIPVQQSAETPAATGLSVVNAFRVVTPLTVRIVMPFVAAVPALLTVDFAMTLVRETRSAIDDISIFNEQTAVLGPVASPYSYFPDFLVSLGGCDCEGGDISALCRRAQLAAENDVLVGGCASCCFGDCDAGGYADWQLLALDYGRSLLVLRGGKPHYPRLVNGRHLLLAVLTFLTFAVHFILGRSVGLLDKGK